LGESEQETQQNQHQTQIQRSAETAYMSYLKRLVKLGANLLDPESVKAVIGKQKVKNGTKIQYVAAYAAFACMEKISWELPKYRQEEIIPFIPDEAGLIAS
jgi:hypothetical protein